MDDVQVLRGSVEFLLCRQTSCPVYRYDAANRTVAQENSGSPDDSCRLMVDFSMRRLIELLRDLREARISHDDAWRMLATKHTAGPADSQDLKSKNSVRPSACE